MATRTTTFCGGMGVESPSDNVQMFAVPTSIDIPKSGTESEHLADIDASLAIYRTHGIEPQFIQRNRHGGIHGVHESTHIYFGVRDPFPVPRDYAEEARWEEEHIENAKRELREARARLKAARARLAAQGASPS